MTNSTNELNPAYVLGHTDHELRRLRNQARLLEPITKRYLQEAGITAGMRVLDVGSGAGDVAFLAAELVGKTGEVVGTDQVPAAVATATDAATARGLSNVQFRQGNPAEMEFDQTFDAVVGRYVLPFQADPAAMLRGLARHLTSGGLLVFHEPDWTVVRSFPPAPLYDRACRWVDDATRLTGQSWNFLDQACDAFLRAELPAPTVQMQTFVGCTPHIDEWLQAVSEIVESLLPAIERLNLATAEEVELSTFHSRLREEVVSSQSLIVGRSEISIWANVE
jgi:ubiquinone/menaquinone biosynthesis C-methylase UbiE